MYTVRVKCAPVPRQRVHPVLQWRKFGHGIGHALRTPSRICANHRNIDGLQIWSHYLARLWKNVSRIIGCAPTDRWTRPGRHWPHMPVMYWKIRSAMPPQARRGIYCIAIFRYWNYTLVSRNYPYIACNDVCSVIKHPIWANIPQSGIRNTCHW